jgi:serine/threonine protein kinase
MALALQTLRSHGYVHSDIKPDNILVQLDPTHTKIEEVKLIDFGSSFKFEEM